MEQRKLSDQANTLVDLSKVSGGARNVPGLSALPRGCQDPATSQLRGAEQREQGQPVLEQRSPGLGSCQEFYCREAQPWSQCGHSSAHTRGPVRAHGWVCPCP